jgi:hypothetical protein
MVPPGQQPGREAGDDQTPRNTMFQAEASEDQRMKKPSTTLRGTVEKNISSPVPSEPDKAQIAIAGAEPLYKELRIENTLTDASGNEVQLKRGAEVEVTVEAESRGVTSKTDHKEGGLILRGAEFSQMPLSFAENSNREERHSAVSYGPGERLLSRRRSE